MKTTYHFKTIVLFIALFLGYSASSNAQFCQAIVNNNVDYNVPEEGGTFTMPFSHNCGSSGNFTFPDKPNWITRIEVLNASSIEIVVAPNGGAERNAPMRINYNGSFADGFEIVQAGTAVPPPPPPPPVNCSIGGFGNDGAFSGTGESRSYTLNFSNCASPNLVNYTFALQPQEASEWVTISPLSGTELEVRFAPNPDFTPRNVLITASHPDQVGFGSTFTQSCEARTWYRDADRDQHAISTMQSCDIPGPDYTLTPLPLDDCDDGDPSLAGPRFWYLDADNDGFGDPNVPTATPSCEPPTGYVRDNTDFCPAVNDPQNRCGVDPTPGIPATADKSYVYARAYQVERSATQTTPFFTSSDDVIQNITYLDGLGRTLQAIGIDHSPNRHDIVTFFDYDGFNRSEKQYLPYATTDGALATFRLDALERTSAHYNTPKYQNTSNPYVQTEFELSPLNRAKRQAAPGDAWALGSNHEIKSAYFTNTLADEIKQYEVSLVFQNGAYTPTLINGTTYPDGELRKTIVRDENNTSSTQKDHSTEEFTNKSGQVVLKRTYAHNERHDTYYVYDDYGNLSFVLSPQMNASSQTLTQVLANIDALGYRYMYDRRNRLVEKQLPGKDPEQIIYNRLDQPIMTQHANQQAIGEWIFTKYDAFGRVAYTGKVNDTRTRHSIQNEVDTSTLDSWVQDGSTALLGTDQTLVPYSNTGYPISNIQEILTINYYDGYAALNPVSFGAPTTVSPFGINNDLRTTGLTTGSKVRVLDVSPAQWVTTVIYYDDKARPIYIYSANDYLQSVDIVESRLDFVGRVLQSRTEHRKNGRIIVTIDNFTYDHVGRLLGQSQCIGDQNLGYDCPGGTPVQDLVTLNSTLTQSQAALAKTRIRLSPGFQGTASTSLQFSAQIDPNATAIGGDQELIVFNDYDELGRLDYKKVGGNPEDILANSTGLQTINYSYNVRDWLTGINNNGLTNNALTIDQEDLFGFRIDYNTTSGGATPLYNGNISRTAWRSQNQDKSLRSYTYSYDALNRISAATDNIGNYNLQNVSYDKNGNILTLDRKGHTNAAATSFDLMDDLSYVYDSGNKLLSVTDAISGTAAEGGFKDGNKAGNDYGYDVNGNLTMDRNKGITGIEYNHLNLPTQVMINGNGNIGIIDYIYTADGTKIEKIVSEGSSLTATEYCGNFIYEKNGTNAADLKFFSHPEGYIEPDGTGGYDYIYQYKDHLGNIRLSYSDDNEDGVASTSEIREENNYYPFGLKHKGYNNVVSANANSTAQKFKYANKEKEEELGLNTISYGQRDYDPALGRFNKIDRFAEKYHSETPYHFTKNNPLIYREIQGDSVWIFTEAVRKEIAGVNVTVGRHAFLRVQTDKQDVIVELWGPTDPSTGEQTRTGIPRVDSFSWNNVNGRSSVSSGTLIEPKGNNDNFEFENSIIEFANLFKNSETTTSEGKLDFTELPNYNAFGPNSNGFVNSLVKNAGGVDLDFPLSGIGASNTEFYDRAINNYMLTQLRDNVCNSSNCSQETLDNLDSLIQQNIDAQHASQNNN